MEIKGKIYCFFEQSGTFKNEFRKLGYEAEDYDIQNEYGETDHICDLFAEIEAGYDGKPSIFDEITPDDLVLAFFPCIYFCDMSQILHTWGAYPDKDAKSASDIILKRSQNRQYFYELVVKMLTLAKIRNIRLILENPWGTQSFLQRDFVTPPTFVDKDRSRRGDFFAKPTAYWFINSTPTTGVTTFQPKKKKRVKKDAKPSKKSGICSQERSEISPDYARNFICDFIIGKVQQNTLPTLF